MNWRWFVREYPSGPRLFRLATDGSTVERSNVAGWVAVPGALERLLTDPYYREINEQELQTLPQPPEERKATGLKPGGGSRPQLYGQHGKYGRLAPVSGQTVKTKVAEDLTLAALPEAVQDKSLAQMEQSLGVDYETAVEHLVAMAESAGPKGLPGREWYLTARSQAVASAVRHGVDPQVGIAVTAAMSPGTKWEENIRNADAIMSMHSQWDKPIDPAHLEATNAWGAKEDKTTKAPNSTSTAVAGETLKQLYAKDPHLAAVYSAKKIGASVGYSYDNFYKGLDLVAANNPAAIDATLNGAKVRSFYNNISEPNSTAGDVTIDIHMQRAMSNDLASTTPDEKHAHMVSIAKRSSAITGSPSYAGASLGAMPVMADVTREATKRFNQRHRTNLLPSEFQAVVWTEQIAQFTPQTVEAILKAPVP